MATEALMDRAAVPAEGAVGDDELTVRIIEAALVELERFGLRRTSVEDVARRAGVARVTVYRRFASKRALVEAAILSQLQEFLVELDGVFAKHPNGVARMTEAFVFSVGYIRRHRLLGRLLETEPEEILPYLTREAGPPMRVVAAHAQERLLETPEGARLAPARRRLAVETMLRLGHSIVLSPHSAFDFGDRAELRRFAEASVRSLLRD